MSDIEITFTDEELEQFRQCIKEDGGYASKALAYLTGKDSIFWNDLLSDIKNAASQSDRVLRFSKEKWVSIYEGINVVMYELGPEELHTLTGYGLQQIASLNLKIYRSIFRAKVYSDWN